MVLLCEWGSEVIVQRCLTYLRHQLSSAFFAHRHRPGLKILQKNEFVSLRFCKRFGKRFYGSFPLQCCFVNAESGVIVWRRLIYLRHQFSSAFFAHRHCAGLKILQDNSIYQSAVSDPTEAFLQCCCVNVESGFVVWRCLNHSIHQLSCVFFFPPSSCKIKYPIGKFYLLCRVVV